MHTTPSVRFRFLLPAFLALLAAGVWAAPRAAAVRARRAAPAAIPEAQDPKPATKATPTPQATPTEAKPAPALLEVDKVVDGDTIWVRRDGKVEKLRLLCVDTEEKLSGGASSPTKPATVFGEECALWAQKYFADLARDGKPARVGLVFPGGVEKRDVYGRLLCYLTLPDGTDYNLMLLKLGKSPYFTKYGRSELHHEQYAAAQREAREKKLGIWNPETNKPKTEGTPSARRPYERLLPWWDVRGDAVETFRTRRAAAAGSVFDAEDPESLEQAAKAEGAVDVFGEVGQLFPESSGDLTVLFRSGHKEQALRVRIPASAREAHATLDLDGLTQEFRQNYAWFHGKITRGERGFEAVSKDPAAWKRAGPEPKLPAEAK